MEANIRIIMVEDNPGDAKLLRFELEQAAAPSIEVVHEVRLAEALRRFRAESFDVVLLDLNLPDSRGLDTLVQMREAAPRMAVVVLTGMEDMALGVEALKKGAQDYLIKSQAEGPLLVRAICYSLERKRMESEREELVRQLQEALARVKTLSGLLPICSWCKKIRDDKGYWTQLETYIREHSEAGFTHGMCPECMRKELGEFEAGAGDST